MGSFNGCHFAVNLPDRNSIVWVFDSILTLKEFEWCESQEEVYHALLRIKTPDLLLGVYQYDLKRTHFYH